MRLLRYLWAGPTTLVGLVLVPLALVGQGGGRVRVVDGVVEVTGGWLAWLLRRVSVLSGGVAALTLGHVVLARDQACANDTRAHERAHVRQCERWGPFFLPAYLAASVWAALRGGNFYRDNWFEREARAAASPDRLSKRSDQTRSPMSGTHRSERDMALATFGAGCFWGVEVAFRQVPGVTNATVGYLGGHLENPTYQDVCTGTTGHAEVVQVEYDPDRVSYEQLLDVFWKSHDPTTLNRQGPDVGTQYRSAIFYHTPRQEAQARVSKEALEKSGRLSGLVVTEITPASAFYRAEEYHQRYLEKRGLASCHVPSRDEREA